MRACLVAIGLCGAASTAHAFCGLYAGATDQPLVADATQVVIMRMGTRTVVSIEPAYQGPAEPFALVVPVPAVLREGDVKTLPKAVFAHVEEAGAPRLVETWEQDPCVDPGPKAAPAVEVAASVESTAQLATGEYEISILPDGSALDTWLSDHHFHLPAGAAPLLRSYVARGMKLVVAKVDPAKVKLDRGRAVLSPLRFQYDSDELVLPIRLGLANSAGTQDLIVSVLAPHQSFRVASYPGAEIATNLDVDASVADRFSAFYAALFDATLAKHPHSFVTEYSGPASLAEPELLALGADVLAGERGQIARYDGGDFVLTRMHMRYGKDLASDLAFAPYAPAFATDFQARYAIRHRWIGPIRCTSPVFGRWQQEPPVRALDLATAPRGGIDLAQLAPALRSPPGPPQSAAGSPQSPSGCACAPNDLGSLSIILVVLVRPKRRRARFTRA